MRRLYTALLWLLLPVAMAIVYRRSKASAARRGRWAERFGRVAPAKEAVEVWIHAASVGEVRAASPLIDALLAQHGDGRVAVTTTTATGSDQVLAQWSQRVVHSYLPFDIPQFVECFLDRLRPRRAVIMESELWPNLFASLRRRKVPLLLANARMSPRSLRRYRRVRKFMAQTLSCCSCVAAQTHADAASFVELGAARVEICGNCKFECTVPREQVNQGLALRSRLGANRPVWAAVSTHAREDEWALEAHRRVLQTFDAVLILVPRHPQRFDQVWGLLQASSLRSARRSRDQESPQTQVLLGDSMGEMFRYLAATDAVFVGGSLVPIGGHNVLEPAALGLPVVFGRSMHNFTVPRQMLLDAGGAIEIDEAAALAPVITRVLSEPVHAREMGLRAQAMMAQHQGATARLMRLLDSLTRTL